MQTARQAVAERIMVGFIVGAASECVGLISAYLVMFDAGGILP